MEHHHHHSHPTADAVPVSNRRGLAQVEFRVGDMMSLDFPDAAFDAVACVFGIFFVPDMPGAVRELWRRVESLR